MLGGLVQGRATIGAPAAEDDQTHEGSIRVFALRCALYSWIMRKTSIYLDDEQAERLARLARTEGRPQAEIVREAISRYRPAPKRDRNFTLAGNFERIDADARPISEVPEDELMRGFGE